MPQASHNTLRRRAGERQEREDGNENCGVTHGVVLCGSTPRLLWARQVGVKATTTETTTATRAVAFLTVQMPEPRTPLGRVSSWLWSGLVVRRASYVASVSLFEHHSKMVENLSLETDGVGADPRRKGPAEIATHEIPRDEGQLQQ